MSINKENVKDIKYIDKIIDGTQNISYDNTTSGLSSNTIKDAIDELSSGGNYDFSVPNVYNTVPVRSETGTIAATSLIISTADGLKECGVWNDIDKTYDFNLINGSVGQLFQEAHICGKAYGNITNGQVCMFAGAQGDHILISPADTSTPGFRSEWIVGVATNDIDNGDFGYVTWFGKVNQLNTISNPAGTILYLNPAVNGGLTPTKPTAPNVKMSIAAVVRSHATEGSLMVRPNLGAYLGDLHDVHVDSPTDKNYLQYSTANSRWEATVSPTTLSGYGITDAYTKSETEIKIVELSPPADLSDYYTKTEVNTAIANVVDSAPETLDTLNELAAALGDDPNFATTVATNIGTVNSNVNTHIANTSNPHSVTKTQVGLSNVDNTSDANKPVSTATQTALNLKANIASPTFTGTVGGITSSMVGLGNVTNESKATMFSSPTFTGTVSGVTGTMVGLGNVENKSSATIRSEITSSNVTTALGYTPYNSTNPAGYTTNTGTVTGVTGTAPIVSSGGTAPAISISAATTSAAGSMSAADKTKLDGVATGATANTGTVTSVATSGAITGGTITSTGTISHSTSDGYLHVPATSTTNNGKVLTAGSTAGALSWTTPTVGTVTSVGGTGSYGGLTLSGTVTTSGNLTLGGTPTGTWPISVSGSSGSCTGNAATATNISNSGTVTLASATESNSIYVTAPSYTTDTPVKLLNFDWYSNVFSIGNIRSGATPTNGFGIYYTASGGSRTEIARFGTSGSFNVIGALTQNSNQVLHAGNYTSYSPSLTGSGASGTWGISISGNAATATSAATATNATGTGNIPKLIYEANLNIIRGVVNNAGGIVYGSGYSSIRTATGQMTITFTTAFTVAPTVIAQGYSVSTDPNADASVRAPLSLYNVTTSSFRTLAFNPRDFNWQDKGVHFMTLGK